MPTAQAQSSPYATTSSAASVQAHKVKRAIAGRRRKAISEKPSKQERVLTKVVRTCSCPKFCDQTLNCSGVELLLAVHADVEG